MLNVSKGRGYYSKHLMAKAVKVFYKKFDLYPSGLGDNLPAVSDWADKCGEAIARLVPWMHFSFLLCLFFVFFVLFFLGHILLVSFAMFSFSRPCAFDHCSLEAILPRTRACNGFATTWKEWSLGLICFLTFLNVDWFSGFTPRLRLFSGGS